jgi:hypothetical protein
MRWAMFAGLAFLSLGTAWAQNGGSEIVIPPAPPLTPEAPPPPAPVQPAPQLPPPGLVQTAPPPAGDTTAPSSSGAPPASVANQPPPPDVPPTQQDSWTPGTTAVLGVLNKVDGSTAQLQLPVGAQAQTTGDLSVSVQACLSRPAGQIPDAAIFLTVVPTQQGSAPIYRGWMLRSAPGATFVGNAGQTFRVIGCS